MPSKKDWKKILKEQEIKDNAKIITELPDEFNIKKILIKFKCNCNEIFEKKGHIILNGKMGFYCKKCANIIKTKRIKKTNFKKYGVEYISQSKDIKEKVKNTWNNKTKEQINEITDKHKKTNLKKYGVEYITQSNLIKEKVKKTNLKKYGVEIPLQSLEIRKKMKQTNLEKYGVENVIQSKKIRDKIKKTFLDRYGVKNISQLQEIKDKIKETWNNKTDEELEEIYEKRKEKCLKEYGYENPLIQQYNRFRC